jgi:alpha-amylase
MVATRPFQVLFLLAALVAAPGVVRAQAGFEDDRVMLQGFYWESYRHGDPMFRDKFGDARWYAIVKDQADAIRAARFDLVWLPPPCYAGERSAGYNPKQYWKLDNSYGTFAQHRAMLEALLGKGVEPVADLVLNHRDGDTGWADFKNPDWGPWAVCRDDELFSKGPVEFRNLPLDQRGAAEERPTGYTQHGGTTYQYDSFRDIDHTNKQVRRDILKAMLALKSAGYCGWRYDMVHGYHARWVALYNKRTAPTFSVGEYDWDKHAEQRGWVYYTSTTPVAGNGLDTLKTSSNVFDFTTQFTLKDNKGRYKNWYGFDNGLGIMGDNTDKLPWKNRAVTFLENHDTGFRTEEDGRPQRGHEQDNFANNWEVEQGYAYILTHPGVPCVYWKHYFDWRPELRERIKALINARKVAGVHAGSDLFVQMNAKTAGVYAAYVKGKAGDLYVRVGGSDADWHPGRSSYKDYREYAWGDGWKVWVGLPGNPEVKQAPLRDALPVPAYQPADQFTVPDADLEP